MSNAGRKVLSQPSLSGAGERLRTRLITSLDTLKSLGRPTRLDDLQILLGLDDLHPGTQLFELFESNERVLYDPKTSLYSWKPEYNLKSPEDVYRVLRAHHARGGMPFKTLRESWPGVQPVIEQLESEGKVFVQRSGGAGGREPQMKVIYWNENENAKNVDQEFRAEWRKIASPTADELPQALQTAGLAAATVDPSVAQASPQNKKSTQSGKKKRTVQRRHRITNTHLAGTMDMSKYSSR